MVLARSKRYIILIGLRASGKSSLAAALAKSLGIAALDLDDLTAERLGYPTASEAFVHCGEARFREAEARACGDALQGDIEIIALGGGTPTAPGVAQLIQSARNQGQALVVFLDPPLTVLADRLRHNAGGRPSITGRGVIDEIDEIARQRRPLYAALADLVVTRDEPLEETVATVAARFRGSSSTN